MNKATTIILLQIVDDFGGAHNFHPVEKCYSKAEAIALAWKRHDDFLESEYGKDFRGDNCLNVHENDFIKTLTNDDMVVTANEDMTCYRFYKLTTIEIRTSVAVVRG